MGHASPNLDFEAFLRRARRDGRDFELTVVVTGLSGIPLVPLAIDDRISATDILRSADSLLLAVVVQYMAIGFFRGTKHKHTHTRASARLLPDGRQNHQRTHFAKSGPFCSWPALCASRRWDESSTVVAEG